MSAPYSSGFIGEKIPPLRFWSYKILPLVYEDALSYYEVLCKVREKLNETIEKTNLTAEEVENIREIVDGIKETVEAIEATMVKSVNGKTPDAEGGVIVDAPSIPLNPPLIIADESRNYLQEAISALIAVDEQAAEELHEYMKNSAPYLVQIVNVGGTPELSVTGAEYDEMVQDVSEHGKTILVSFPDDEYTYNGESYRMYPQIGKLITNGALEVSRVVSIAGGAIYEQYRFDRNGYISYDRRTYPELPVAPSENGEYTLIRTADGLSWGNMGEVVTDLDVLNQYWKPTVLPVTYTPSNDTANPDYSPYDFSNSMPPDEGAILVEIRTANNPTPIRVQGCFVLGDATHNSYVHAVFHDKVGTKNVLRVYYLYSTYVDNLTYDLDILRDYDFTILNKAVQKVNGRTPDSTGAVVLDATLINLGATPLPITVHDKIVEVDTEAQNAYTLAKAISEILDGAPQDGQRYKLTATYDATVGQSVPQWVLDT